MICGYSGWKCFEMIKNEVEKSKIKVVKNGRGKVRRSSKRARGTNAAHSEIPGNTLSYLHILLEREVWTHVEFLHRWFSHIVQFQIFLIFHHPENDEFSSLGHLLKEIPQSGQIWYIFQKSGSENWFGLKEASFPMFLCVVRTHCWHIPT